MNWMRVKSEYESLDGSGMVALLCMIAAIVVLALAFGGGGKSEGMLVRNTFREATTTLLASCPHRGCQRLRNWGLRC